MARVKFVLNPAGVEELLTRSETQAHLLGRAARIAAAAGPGHEADVSVGRTRARASARTVTIEAMVNELRHRTLTRAIDAGR